MELAALENIGYTQENGLVICKNHSEDLHTSEWYHIVDKAKRLEVDAVLFRRYFDSENKHINSKPSVYIFQKGDSFFNKKEHQDLHAKLWSAGEIDVYVILGQTRLDIVNARRPADSESSNGLDLESLKLVSESITQFNDYRFSAHIFGKGMFWEQGSWDLDEKQTPFQIILKELTDARKKLHTNRLTSEQNKVLDKLLLLSILIMFLEEKKDNEGNYALKQKYAEFNVQTFAQIVRDKEQCIEFLRVLSDTERGGYNGQIFNLTSDEEIALADLDLEPIALFVEGKVSQETTQISIWRKYNFDFIPIELISSIYEDFLQSENEEKEKGVVYTPPFLVNFLIDEVMPLNRYDLFKNNSFKILDPSCGSGIFLVAAYKRLLDWWVINNYTKFGNLSQKDISDIFKQILEDNIFGVDINKTATQISIFSLTIAFLDKIDPKLLWEKFEFKNLSEKNITKQNFFEWASTAPKDFDLVIGNPPFNVPTEYEQRVKEHHKKFVTPFQQEMGFKYSAPIPDGFAFYFLEFARVLSPQKKVCLIIPAALLLYSPQKTSINYRKALFENSNVEKIYDFTHLRRVLFKRNNVSTNSNSKEKTKQESVENSGADIPVCVIILNNTEPQYKSIEHTVIKRLVSTEKKLRFEIDHYDCHFVRFDWACRYPFVWKCNILGGGRLFHLIYRLSLLQNLEGFIKEKQKENDEWIFEEGYKLNGKDRFTNPPFYDLLHKDKVDYLKDYSIVFCNDKESNINFHRPHSERLYKIPLIIIQKSSRENLLFALKDAHHDSHISFSSKIIAIHSPIDELKNLQKIYNRIKNHEPTYLLWILATSASRLVAKETAFDKKDFDTLPFPDFTDEEEEYLEFNDTEKILRDDVLNHYKHLGKSTNGDGYEPLEKKLNVNQPKDREILDEFGKAFCNNLNEIYAKNGNSWQRGKIYQTKSTDKISEGFIIYQFGFGLTTSEPENIEIDESYLKTLIFDTESNRSAIWVRVGRVYQHTPNGYDCVFLIKPANIRYWLRSVALRDADDTFKDLKQAGL